MSEQEHISVLLNEAINALNIKPDGVYVDGTFGRGGHSQAILEKLNENGRLIVFDKDPQAIEIAQQLAQKDKRITVIHNGFVAFQAALTTLNINEIDGALFDLGKLSFFSKEILGKMKVDEIYDFAYSYAKEYNPSLLELINRDKTYFKSILNIERDKADWHTMEGAGFLFDVNIENKK